MYIYVYIYIERERFHGLTLAPFAGFRLTGA